MILFDATLPIKIAIFPKMQLQNRRHQDCRFCNSFSYARNTVYGIFVMKRVSPVYCNYLHRVFVLPFNFFFREKYTLTHIVTTLHLTQVNGFLFFSHPDYRLVRRELI